MSNSLGISDVSYYDDKTLSDSEKRFLSKPILYPKFIEAMKYIDDSFWIKKLERASRNYFPKNVKFKKNFYEYRKNTKIYSERIVDDPEKIAEQYINFMGKMLSMYSDRQNNETIITNRHIKLTFKSLKNHRLRRNMIYKYINKVEQKMIENEKINKNLTRFQKRDLYNIIDNAVKNGILNEKTTKISNNRLKIRRIYSFDEEYDTFMLKSKYKNYVKNKEIHFQEFSDNLNPLLKKHKSNKKQHNERIKMRKIRFENYKIDMEDIKNVGNIYF